MTILNALTFDVEEYFQVTGFAGAVSPAHWDLYEPRAERSTDELLELLAAADATVPVSHKLIPYA